ncbi:protein DpdD [Nocardia wallacei]|uniref:protein DpdD n=1 Tax=Nocardia wallacei TaxID=480035 RepID=UPI0024576CBB|nr:protein DpdD [Nocardia wallacei]
MTETEVARAPGATRRLLHAFFAASVNDAWPDMAESYEWADRTRPFVDNALNRPDLPLVLPAFKKSMDRFTLYVVVAEREDVVPTSELIKAFAGPSHLVHASMERPARLDPAVEVERILLEAVHAAAVFRLGAGPVPKQRARLTDALRLMQEVLARRPARSWRVAKPAGRLLAEFDAALAAGGEASSAAILDQLRETGGLDASNLAYLTIKRLNRLGKDTEIQTLTRLSDVIRQEPPTPVREALLESLYFSAIEKHLAADDLDRAIEVLSETGTHVQELLNGPLRLRSTSALTIAVLAGIIGDDHDLLAHAKAQLQSLQQLEQLPAALRTELLNRTSHHSDDAMIAAGAQPAISSWGELVAALSEGSPAARTVLQESSWQDWPSPADDDEKIAGLLDGLQDDGAEQMWSVVGAFLEAIGYDDPAAHSAEAFILNALTYSRFHPGDLLAIQALLGVALRGAPSADRYSRLLREIGSESDRWVAPERASTVLDIVDALVLAACPDEAARQQLAYRLLTPLSRHSERLDTADIAFARVLDDELALGLPWQTDGNDEKTDSETWFAAEVNVLLYSLDEKVLGRVTEQLRSAAPNARVTTSSDHVGSPRLRQWVQHADLIVLITRCATHAATGFISNHTSSEKIAYVDGSGSASLLRTTLTELKKRFG